jgi:hypothetical protein
MPSISMPSERPCASSATSRDKISSSTTVRPTDASKKDGLVFMNDSHSFSWCQTPPDLSGAKTLGQEHNGRRGWRNTSPKPLLGFFLRPAQIRRARAGPEHGLPTSVVSVEHSHECDSNERALQQPEWRSLAAVQRCIGPSVRTASGEHPLRRTHLPNRTGRLPRERMRSGATSLVANVRNAHRIRSR